MATDCFFAQPPKDKRTRGDERRFGEAISFRSGKDIRETYIWGEGLWEILSKKPRAPRKDYDRLSDDMRRTSPDWGQTTRWSEASRG